ncbi:MAG: nitronate monooxygenase [Spirochaetia bacterium]|nr:nitronate monooxygenase [Spirochaetia bacterium]
MPKLIIRSKTAEVPIIQGGMGVGISLSSLSSAVAGNGGVGVIAANGIGMIDPNYFKDGRAANIRSFRKEIREARRKTSGVIGVNIMVALEDFQELLQTAIEERVDMVFLGAGLPIKNLPVTQMREADVQIIPIVSSSRAATLIFSMWKKLYGDVPDAVVVEGPKAGGHLGFKEEELDGEAFSLETVIPQVVSSLKVFEKEFNRSIPVIAAGGIFTGDDIYQVMKLGASGVQMGTRFAATDECDADIRFKEAIVACNREDIGIIKSPVGMPGRAIINNFLTDRTIKKYEFNCPWQCLAGCHRDEANYCISLALNNARKGNLKHGFVFVGSNAYRVNSIVPVKELMSELKEEYMASLFADKKKFVTDVAEIISSLKDEYKTAEIRFGELKGSYMKALTHATDNLSEPINRLKKEMDKVNEKLLEIKGTITDKVHEAYGILQYNLS